MTAIEWFNALQWIHVVLIVAILLLFAGYIYLLRKITQLQYVGGRIGKRNIQFFGILFGSLVIFYLFYNLHELQPNDWVEISLLVGLVAATSALALYAAGQTDASVKMAEEITRPYLLLRLTNEYLQWEDGTDSKTPREFLVTVYNAGKGPAINLSASLWKHTDIFAVTTKGYLAANQEWEASISKLSTDGIALGGEIPYPQLKDEIQRNRISVAVEYEDIHHREWVSYLYLEEADGTGYVKDGEQNIVELKNHD